MRLEEQAEYRSDHLRHHRTLPNISEVLLIWTLGVQLVVDQDRLPLYKEINRPVNMKE